MAAKQQSTSQPQMNLTVGRAVGLEPAPGQPVVGAGPAEVKVELDAPLEHLDGVFLATGSPTAPVVLLQAGKVVASVTLGALATQVLRLGPSALVRGMLLDWGERSDLYWCDKGLHWSMTPSCPEHPGGI